MLPEEIISSLKSLTTKHGVKISEIEIACLVPKNSLASVITQKRAFPMKHKERLQEYCKAKEIGILLGSDKAEKLDGKQKFVNSDAGWAILIHQFCAKRGFPPEQLFEKFEELEKTNEGLRLANQILGEEGQNRSIPAPKPEKLPDVPKKEDKGGKGVENAPETNGKGWVIREKPKMPEGLTPLQQDLWKIQQKKLKP